MKEQGWHPKLAHTFSGITAQQGFWRTNWGVIPHNLNTHLLHDDGIQPACLFLQYFQYVRRFASIDFISLNPFDVNAGTYATAEDIASYFGANVESAGAGDEAISAGEAIFNHWNEQFGVEGPQVRRGPSVTVCTQPYE
jgi:hypothetical protein